MNYISNNLPTNWNRSICSRRRRSPPTTFPPVSSTALTFYYDRSSKKFDKSFYSPALTNGRLSTEQLSLFLRDIEHIIKRKSPSIGVAVGFLIFVLLFGIWAISSLIDDDYDTMDNDYDTMDDNMDDFFFAMMLYFFMVAIGALGLKSYFISNQKKVRKEVEGFIEDNHYAFAAQGLKWNVPLHFPMWIELWTDYKEEVMPQQYIPYAAPYQPQMMMMQQHYPAHQLNFAGTNHNQSQQNNGAHHISMNQQEDGNGFYHPPTLSETIENKYPQFGN